MTANKFERWFRSSRLSRKEAAALFGRGVRTLDGWRKDRTPVLLYAQPSVLARIPMQEKRSGVLEGKVVF